MITKADSICIKFQHIKYFNPLKPESWYPLNYSLNTLAKRNPKFRQYCRYNQIGQFFLQKIIIEIYAKEITARYVRIGLDENGVLGWEYQE